jgi:hypothetical protein
LESRGVVCLVLVMVVRLEFGRWHVANGAVQAPVIPPVDPLGSRQLGLLKRPPGATCADELGFVQTVDGFRECIAYESPREPTEHTAPASASRSV